MVHASCSFAEKLMSNHFTLYIFFFLVSVNCVQNQTLPQHMVKQPRELERPSSPITLDFPGILWARQGGSHMYLCRSSQTVWQTWVICLTTSSFIPCVSPAHYLPLTFLDVQNTDCLKGPWFYGQNETPRALRRRHVITQTPLTIDQYSFRMTKLRPNVAEQ